MMFLSIFHELMNLRSFEWLNASWRKWRHTVFLEATESLMIQAEILVKN